MHPATQVQVFSQLEFGCRYSSQRKKRLVSRSPRLVTFLEGKEYFLDLLLVDIKTNKSIDVTHPTIRCVLSNCLVSLLWLEQNSIGINMPL